MATSLKLSEVVSCTEQRDKLKEKKKKRFKLIENPLELGIFRFDSCKVTEPLPRPRILLLPFFFVFSPLSFQNDPCAKIQACRTILEKHKCLVSAVFKKYSIPQAELENCIKSHGESFSFPYI